MVHAGFDVIEYDVDDSETSTSAATGQGVREAVWAVVRRAGVPQALLETTRAALANDAQIVARAGADPLAVRDADLPGATVVVASIVQRLDDLDRCLTDLGQLDYPEVRVLLVDNRTTLPSPDPLDPILARHPHVERLHQPLPGAAMARNLGARHASTEVVAFTDDDVRVDRQWLRAIGRRFAAAPDATVVTGLILPAELESDAQVWFERYYGGFAGERIFQRLTLRPGRGTGGRGRVTAYAEDGSPVRTHPLYGVGAYGAGANMAVRRSALAEVGGFDPLLGPGTPARGGEDLATIIRMLWAGGELAYEPAAYVFHRHRPEYDELLQQLRTYGSGFTAMLTSLVASDPRHLVAIGAQLPEAAGRVVGQVRDRLRGRGQPDAPRQATPNYPRELVRTEYLGMPFGPAAYVRSRATRRRRGLP